MAIKGDLAKTEYCSTFPNPDCCVWHRPHHLCGDNKIMIDVKICVISVLKSTFHFGPKLSARDSVFKPAAMDKSSWPNGCDCDDYGHQI